MCCSYDRLIQLITVCLSMNEWLQIRSLWIHSQCERTWSGLQATPCEQMDEDRRNAAGQRDRERQFFSFFFLRWQLLSWHGILKKKKTSLTARDDTTAKTLFFLLSYQLRDSITKNPLVSLLCSQFSQSLLHSVFLNFPFPCFNWPFHMKTHPIFCTFSFRPSLSPLQNIFSSL